MPAAAPTGNRGCETGIGAGEEWTPGGYGGCDTGAPAADNGGVMF